METHGLNAARMKERNYRRFINALRFKPMTRAQMGREMGLTRAATGVIAENLIFAGVIREGPLHYQGQYSSKALFWNKDFCHIGGINLGRDSIKAGLADFSGNVLDSRHIPISECCSGPDAIHRISLCLEQMLEARKPAGRFLGIGVASPGPLNTESGTILKPPSFDLMWNCPVSSLLSDRFHCDVVLENDANALAMAERWYGLNGKYDRFMELLVDTGVGAALILDGRLYIGSAGFGNGFGHTSIDMNGPRCVCGNNGCVEMYAAIPRIAEAAKKTDPSLDSWRAIVDAACDGEALALQALNNEAQYLALLIVNASNVLNIQAVVFAGEQVLYRPALLLATVEQEVNRRIAASGERSIAILPSQIPDNAKILSCTNLMAEKYLEQPFMFSDAVKQSESDGD
ncbi:MAG: ROK family protein [Gracilibacteraceae bacterium]|jgi:predicted NBD/HSP70 family sugar kinase|nr:ROK family protein [Gracilibacteraceae bacterium]